jgi:hypothetical protein
VFTAGLKEITDPITHALTLLGTFPAYISEQNKRSIAIVRIEKTALSTDVLREGVLGDVRVIESTDIARSLAFSASAACADG